jgi:RNA polymerase sigma factor (sigma-70 family)
MEHEQLVRRACSGDVAAFVELTRRFQQFAFGSALTLVRDFQHAEDVVQEAFVAAWSALPGLEEPAAFPGWLRSIVRYHAFRQLRRKRHASVPLVEAESVADEEPLPDYILEQRRQANAALAAISELPDRLREPATLAFVHDCSHQDVATFLGLSLTTVNNRLHAARSHLRKRLAMVTDTLHANALPDEFAHRIGRLIETRGDVVDALFDPAALPDLMTELTVSDEARKGSVKVHVMQRPGGGIVRGLAALSNPPSLPRGATVLSSRRRSTVVVERMQFDRLVPLLTAATTDGRQSNEIVETGIKVIDVMCPIRAGGSVAIAGENGAGSTVVMEEIVRRISKGPHSVTMFMLIAPPSELWPPALEPGYSFSDDLRREGYSEGTVGNVQTFFLTGIKGPWSAETLAPLAPVDTLIHLAREMIVRKNYPGVDVRTTRARLLDESRIDASDVEIARRARDAILLRRAAQDNPEMAVDAVLAERGRKLQAFFSQPFYVAEPYTKRPGSHVSRADALRGCREILDGEHDDLAAEAFYFTGSIDEIRRATGAA